MPFSCFLEHFFDVGDSGSIRLVYPVAEHVAIFFNFFVARVVSGSQPDVELGLLCKARRG